MQTLVSSGNPASWTHFGDGPEKSLIDRCLANDKSNSLKFDLRGQVPLDQVRREMVSGNYDVFINLSLSEGAPVSLMEAQCAGLPVVATDVGGTAEVVSMELNELVPLSAQPHEICAAIMRVTRRSPAESMLRRQHWEHFYNATPNYDSWAKELGTLALSSV